MHIGELIRAASHILRLSRVCQMDATHKIAVHKFLMTCNPSSAYAMYKMLVLLNLSMVRAGISKRMSYDVVLETTV